MADYYVGKDGADANPGTYSQRFRTIAAAIAAMNISGGDRAIIGPGTYAEDTAAAGFLNINRLFLAATTLLSEYNNKDSVVITGSTSASLNTFTNAANSNFVFQDLTFGPSIPTTTAAFRVTQTGSMTFRRCKFNRPSSVAAAKYGLQATPSSATAINNLIVDSCIFPQTSTGANGNGIALTCGFAGSTSNACQFTNNIVYGSGASAIAFDVLANLTGNVTNLVITGNKIYSLGPYGLKIGPDAHVAAGTIGATIRGNLVDVSNGTGHGLILGAGADNNIIENNEIYGGDYGCVLKSCASPTFRYNFVRGASVGNPINASALYLKGNVTGAVVDTCTLYCDRGTSTVGTLRWGAGDDASLVSGANIQRCTIITDTRETLAVGTGDANNMTSDNHIYVVRGGGNFGDVRVTPNCATIAAVRAAWVGYGVPTNDANSVVQLTPARSSRWSW